MNFEYQGDYPHGIMFHRFHGNNVPALQGSIDSNQLENLIIKVGIERILSPIQWLEKIKNNTLKDHHVCLTFDDCLKSQVLIADPILKKYNLTAFYFIHSLTFFGEIDFNEVFSNIISSKYQSIDVFMNDLLSYIDMDEDTFFTKKYIDFYELMKSNYSFYSENDIKYRYLRNIFYDHISFNKIMKKYFTEKNYMNNIDTKSIWMDENDLSLLSKSGNMIGLHSYSHHINFKDLSYNKQKQEYEKNKTHLEKIINCKITSASHPLGSYNLDTIKIFNELAIECAFRSNNSIPDGRNSINPNNLELARIDVCDILSQL
jgi:peptidoglycan/xylan/chitin deacetylase (PgdA/CDA1 family)